MHSTPACHKISQKRKHGKSRSLNLQTEAQLIIFAQSVTFLAWVEAWAYKELNSAARGMAHLFVRNSVGLFLYSLECHFGLRRTFCFDCFLSLKIRFVYKRAGKSPLPCSCDTCSPSESSTCTAAAGTSPLLTSFLGLILSLPLASTRRLRRCRIRISWACSTGSVSPGSVCLLYAGPCHAPQSIVSMGQLESIPQARGHSAPEVAREKHRIINSGKDH